jgi:elongation factor P
LYKNGDIYSFMENDSGEMYDLDGDFIWDDITWYLKENLDVFLTINEWSVLGVILPNTANYKIIATVPGVKWDRAQAGKKPATIETWIEIMIPLHKNEWDIVTVNTLTWDVN